MTTPSAPSPQAPSQRDWLWLAAASLLAVIAYWPALHGGFIWSDESFILNNEMMHASDGLRRFWLTTEPADYWPVTATSFWVEWKLWGAHALGYHVTNLILHLADGWLLWALLRRMGIAGAALAACWFILTPINTASVAWIVERKNLLALFFALPCLWAFLPRAEGRPKSGAALCLSGVAFVLALLSKGSVALLPLILLGLVLWRRKPTLGDLVALAPFALVAAAFIGVNVWFQGHHLHEAIRKAGLGERLVGAGAVVPFYLCKALVPLGQVFVYPQWHIDLSDWRWYLPSVGLSAGMAALAWGTARRNPWAKAAFFALLFVGVALAPVMGLTDVYFMKYSLVADHYAHFALVGIAAFLGWAWSRWRQRAAAVAAAIVVLGTFTWLTHAQAEHFSSAEALFTSTIEGNPGSWMAYNNRGILRAQEGEPDLAIADFERAVSLKPDFADGQVDLGNAYARQGRGAEAVRAYEAALRADPRRIEAANGLAILLIASERPGEAETIARQAVAMAPGSWEAHRALGMALVQQQRAEEALPELEAAATLNPASAAACIELGAAYGSLHRYPEAEARYRRALALSPALPKADLELGNVLCREGRFAEAIPLYEEALRALPDNLMLHHNLAVALDRTGRSAEADREYQKEDALRGR